MLMADDKKEKDTSSEATQPVDRETIPLIATLAATAAGMAVYLWLAGRRDR